MNLNKNAKILLAASCIALTGACSVSRNAVETYAKAEAAVEQAEHEGAQERAALEMHAAKENLAKAKTALDEKDEVVAMRLSEEAIVEAELAEKKSQNKKVQLMTKEVEQGVESLENETKR